MKTLLPVLFAALLGLAGCSQDSGSNDAHAADVTTGAQVEPAPAVVDSALPMPEALRRFHASIDEPAPTALTGGAGSVDQLLRSLVRAYQARDAAALDRLAVTKAEFGYLYYPESPYPLAPYELAPDFVWFLVEERGSRGVARAAEFFAGRTVEYAGSDCPGTPKPEGHNHLWGPCFARVRYPDGGEDRIRIANAIMERDGQFKLIGFDNGM